MVIFTDNSFHSLSLYPKFNSCSECGLASRPGSFQKVLSFPSTNLLCFLKRVGDFQMRGGVSCDVVHYSESEQRSCPLEHNNSKIFKQRQTFQGYLYIALASSFNLFGNHGRKRLGLCDCLEEEGPVDSAGEIKAGS